MPCLVSPGVYTREIDFSAYVPALSTSRLGLVGSATKGPVDTVTLITDMGSLVDTFGPPSASHLALFAAERYLRAGRQLYFVRVASGYYNSADAVSAKVGTGAIGFTATSPGTWGENVSIVIGAGTDAGTYKLTIRYNGYPVEVYDLVRVGTANESHRNYIETRLNGISDFVSVSDTGASAVLTAGTTTLSGGADGTPVAAADLIGAYNTPPTVPSTGLHCFDNADDIIIDMVAAPGRSEASIIAALITLAGTTRQDCVALIDPPYGLSVQGVVRWHNGLSGMADAPTAAIDSSYAALAWPWVQIYDSYGATAVWIPPCGHVSMAFANTDYVAEPWYAPAGINRATFGDILAVEHSASQGERDYMYANGNAVNPICRPFGNSSFVLWGQRTLQRASTALDRINVRRMLIYLRRSVAVASRVLVMEPNDAFTWNRFSRMVTPFLSELRQRRAVYDFRVICDENTNTPVVIDRNEMRAKILVKLPRLPRSSRLTSSSCRLVPTLKSLLVNRRAKQCLSIRNLLVLTTLLPVAGPLPTSSHSASATSCWRLVCLERMPMGRLIPTLSGSSPCPCASSLCQRRPQIGSSCLTVMRSAMWLVGPRSGKRP